ncbi:MAG: helix-turn-helix transcriptional regulator [Alphaproteobacteria bacterium]|nr:helix-turn-helix transcriptional regulator [Alphaproteobacteria bacterium]
MSRTGQNAADPPPPVERLVRPVMLRAADLAAGHRYPSHRHDWGQLIYAVEGALRVETQAGNWLAPPQRAVWAPPGVAHAVATPGPAAFRSLYIAREAAAGLPDRVTVLEVDALLRELIRALADLPEAYDEAGPAGRLVSVLLDRLRAAAPAPLHLPLPRDRRLAAIAEALSRDPADGRTLDQFAAEAGASARTLARLFQRETGLSFGQWRTRRRLLAAIERLADGAPVTAIAYDLGYDSPSAFVAMFRRETGTTPARFFAAR